MGIKSAQWCASRQFPAALGQLPSFETCAAVAAGVGCQKSGVATHLCTASVRGSVKVRDAWKPGNDPHCVVDLCDGLCCHSSLLLQHECLCLDWEHLVESLCSHLALMASYGPSLSGEQEGVCPLPLKEAWGCFHLHVGSVDGNRWAHI